MIVLDLVLLTLAVIRSLDLHRMHQNKRFHLATSNIVANEHPQPYSKPQILSY